MNVGKNKEKRLDFCNLAYLSSSISKIKHPKPAYSLLCSTLFTNGGARGIRTLAPVTRSTSLAGKPLEPLEYYSIPSVYENYYNLINF